MKSLIFAGITSLAIAVTAQAATYSAKPEGCTSAGYDRAVLQTDGPYEGMYRCFCNSVARNTALDAQYEWALKNAYRLNLAVTSGDKGVVFKVTPATRPGNPVPVDSKPQH